MSIPDFPFAPPHLPRPPSRWAAAREDLVMEAIGQIYARLREEDGEPAFVRRSEDFDCVEKVSFLRGHVATASLTRLYCYYVRYLGRNLLDAALRESYMVMVDNICMLLSHCDQRPTFSVLESWISEAYMETISRLDDLVMFSTMFPSVGTFVIGETPPQQPGLGDLQAQEVAESLQRAEP